MGLEILGIIAALLAVIPVILNLISKGKDRRREKEQALAKVEDEESQRARAAVRAELDRLRELAPPGDGA